MSERKRIKSLASFVARNTAPGQVSKEGVSRDVAIWERMSRRHMGKPEISESSVAKRVQNTSTLRQTNQHFQGVKAIRERVLDDLIPHRTAQRAVRGIRSPGGQIGQQAKQLASSMIRGQYQEAYRFSDDRIPESDVSKMGQRFGETPATGRPLTDLLARRAITHMDGSTANSQFVSVATDHEKLQEHGDAWVQHIITGEGRPDMRAPHLSKYLLPRTTVHGPEDVRAQLRNSGGNEDFLLGRGLALTRSRLETEMVYHGDDIRHHRVSVVDNPYPAFRDD